jgi:ribose transport system ATP-binding protein
MEPFLQMKGIGKYIFDEDGNAIKNTTVKILDSVDFEVRRGEVHILMGENGAGKSTLMKVLGGLIPPDEGEIRLDDKEVVFRSPKDARKHGIGFIHQELNLCTNLDVAHNIFLGREPKKNYKTDTTSMYKESDQLLRSLGFMIDSRTVLRELSTGQQQVVEIAKTLSYWSNLIIMDEPTASLSKKEIDLLFALIKDLKQKNVSIIYISHRFEEIMEIGDRITVLRDGKLVGTRQIVETSYNEIVQMMVGRTLGDMYACEHVPEDEITLQLQGVQLNRKTDPVDLIVRKGEIVGIGGLVGAGRTELAKTIFGARKAANGTILFHNEDITGMPLENRIRKGMAYLSEDRKSEGLITELNVGHNISLASLSSVFKNGMISNRREQSLAHDMIQKLNIHCRSALQKVKTLSGGNQQRVALAKWLITNPELLILDEPTRGIDVNAKAEIYRMIDTFASRGVSILMISSDLPELIGMSDRIYVMRNGAIAAEITEKAGMTQTAIVSYSIGENA